MVEAARCAGVAIGGGPLTVVTLAWLSISSALHSSKNFADVLVVTLKLLSDLPGWSQSALGRQAKRKGGRSGKKRKPHNPRSTSLFSLSEEAFTQVRQRLPLSFWAYLLLVLSERFEAQHPEHVNWKDFRLLMMDGSHVALPRWKCLADYFGTTSNGKQTQTPQARMVMLALCNPVCLCVTN